MIGKCAVDRSNPCKEQVRGSPSTSSRHADVSAGRWDRNFRRSWLVSLSPPIRRVQDLGMLLRTMLCRSGMPMSAHPAHSACPSWLFPRWSSDRFASELTTRNRRVAVRGWLGVSPAGQDCCPTYHSPLRACGTPLVPDLLRLSHSRCFGADMGYSVPAIQQLY